MLWWTLTHLLRGYRTVDAGGELTPEMAVQLSRETVNRYRKGRRVAVAIRMTQPPGRTYWSVMVKGWNPRKEDG